MFFKVEHLFVFIQSGLYVRGLKHLLNHDPATKKLNTYSTTIEKLKLI